MIVIPLSTGGRESASGNCVWFAPFSPFVATAVATTDTDPIDSGSLTLREMVTLPSATACTESV